MTKHAEMMRRQSVLAEFGDYVLDHEDMDAILTEGCRLIAEALGADLAKVVEIDRDRNVGFVRAGVGWHEGIVGHERISLAESSSETFAIDRAEPVITNDIAAEERFRFARFLLDHGVKALINVPIFLPGRRAWGVLQVDSRHTRSFDEEDIEFLKTYAMVLGPVIDRIQTIAEREDARRAADERDARLRRVLERMGEGFGVLAPDFTILEHNAEATRMDGRPREAIIGRKHWEVYPGSETSELGRKLRAAMASREPFSIEHRVRFHSGLECWLDTRVHPTDDGGLAVFWRDITDRRRAADALRESEARLSAIFDTAPVAIGATDHEGRAVMANQPFRNVFPSGLIPSRDPERIARWRGWDAAGEPLTPDRFPGARALRGEVVVPGQEMVYQEADGTEMWTRVATVPTHGPNGEVTGLVLVATDISENKATERALRESEGRLQTLIEGIPQLVWCAGPDGAWSWASRQWERFTGLTSTASEGRGWLAALHPEDRDRAATAWASAPSRGELHFDCRLIEAASGEPRWFQMRAFPLRTADGSISEWLGTCTDVHELRALQERQRVLVGELQHRTRNLLGVVRAMCDQTAQRSSDFAEFRAKYLDRLNAMARVQGLLSRLGQHDRIAFDELIAMELAAVGAGETEGKVHLSGPRGVRLRSSGVQILAMALHELTTNALKHGALRQEGARLEVSWALERDVQGDPWLAIAWRESGVRMPSPAAVAARGSGQGLMLIERSLPYQLGGETAFRLGADGVDCTIRIPVSQQQPAVWEEVR